MRMYPKHARILRILRHHPNGVPKGVIASELHSEQNRYLAGPLSELFHGGFVAFRNTQSGPWVAGCKHNRSLILPTGWDYCYRLTANGQRAAEALLQEAA